MATKHELCTGFPAPGLRDPFRYITGHNSKGEAVFLQVRISSLRLQLWRFVFDMLVGQTDHGDHKDIMVGGLGAQNCLYSSSGNPIELTGDVDLEFAKQKVG